MGFCVLRSVAPLAAGGEERSLAPLAAGVADEERSVASLRSVAPLAAGVAEEEEKVRVGGRRGEERERQGAERREARC